MIDSARSSITWHWLVAQAMVEVAVRPWGHGWVARAAITLPARTVRLSEVGLDPVTALAKLIEASKIRSEMSGEAGRDGSPSTECARRSRDTAEHDRDRRHRHT